MLRLSSGHFLGLLALATAAGRALTGERFAGPLVGSFEFALLVCCAWSVAYRMAWRCVGPAAPSVVVAATWTWFGAIASVAVMATGFVGVLGGPALLAVVGAARLAAARWLAAPPAVRELFRDSPFDGGRDWFAIALTVAIAGACALGLRNQVLFTVQDADSMWYHLPMAGEWLRTGNLAPIDAIPLIGRGYPGFRQTILAFLSAPFGNEHLALLQVAELPALAVAAYSVARGLGAVRALALAAAFHLVAAPIVSAASTTQGSDVSLALHVLLATLFVRRFAEGGRGGDGVLAGLAAGAVVANKFSGLGAVAVVLLVAFAERGWSLLRSWRGAFAFCVAMAAVAAPWFVRDWLAFGNPVFPAQVKLGDTVVFPGPLTRDWFAPSTIGWDLPWLWEHRRHFVAAHGWFVLVMLAAPLLVLVGVARRRWPSRLGLGAALAPVTFFVLFLHHPFNRMPLDGELPHRYMLPWATIAVATAAAALSRFHRGWQWTAAAAALVLGCANLAKVTHWAPLVGALAVLVATTLRSDRVLRPTRRVLDPIVRLRVPALATLLAVAVAAFGLQQLRTKLQYDERVGWHDSISERGWGPAVAWVHRDVHGQRVGLHGSIYFFPLLGEPFSNEVFVADDLHLEVPRRTPADVAAWALEQRLDWVVCCVPRIDRTTSRDFTFGESFARPLLAGWPQRFELAFERAGAAVLRVKHEEKR